MRTQEASRSTTDAPGARLGVPSPPNTQEIADDRHHHHQGRRPRPVPRWRRRQAHRPGHRDQAQRGPAHADDHSRGPQLRAPPLASHPGEPDMTHLYRISWKYPRHRRYYDHSKTLARAVRIRGEVQAHGGEAKVQVLDGEHYRDMTQGEIRLATMGQ